MSNEFIVKFCPFHKVVCCFNIVAVFDNNVAGFGNNVEGTFVLSTKSKQIEHVKFVSTLSRNLGVYIDEQLTFDVHARACSRACFYHLRSIWQVRRFVDEPELRQLISAFVTSRLDYCNALFADCSDVVRQRLQRIQNSAARVIHSQPVFTRATPLLQNLHWLSVQKRITYKLCMLMFDIVRGSAPLFLTDLCNICSDRRLRSASRGLFAQPRTNTKLHVANRAFSVAGPSAWNPLPSRIRLIVFKRSFCKQPTTLSVFPIVYCYSFLWLLFYILIDCCYVVVNSVFIFYFVFTILA